MIQVLLTSSSGFSGLPSPHRAIIPQGSRPGEGLWVPKQHAHIQNHYNCAINGLDILALMWTLCVYACHY